MKVMVTGGSGFIGSHVVTELAWRGHEPTVFDTRVGYEILHEDHVLNVARGQDAVIHLAGVLGTEELFDRPHVAVRVNVEGTLNVLRACREHSLKYVGITMPSVWANVYQATKRCAKDLASAWYENFDVPVSHVRAFNAYGIGQKVHGVQKIVPTFATKAWRMEPIPIWGDGWQMVDMVHVGDIARMLCDALLFGDDDVFDAGTGKGKYVGEIAQRIQRHVRTETALEPEMKFLPMRLGEKPARVVADGDGWGKLDWRPEWHEDRFLETVDWYRKDRP